jgi:hypothetical protein
MAYTPKQPTPNSSLESSLKTPEQSCFNIEKTVIDEAYRRISENKAFFRSIGISIFQRQKEVSLPETDISLLVIESIDIAAEKGIALITYNSEITTEGIPFEHKTPKEILFPMPENLSSISKIQIFFMDLRPQKSLPEVLCVIKIIKPSGHHQR